MKLERILSLTDLHSQTVTRGLILFLFLASSCLALISGDQLRYPDERDYSNLAHSMLDGKGYANEEGNPTAYRPPGWPFVLTVLYSIHDHPVSAKLLNALALASAAWLLSSLVARETPRGKIFVPLLLLLYPLAWYTATTLYPQIFGAALMAAILVLLSQDIRNVARCAIAGLLLGFLILNIPAFLLLTPLFLAGLYLCNKKTPALIIKRSILILCCAAAVVVPWTMRNAHVFHAFVPVSTNSGINLLLGNSENTGPNQGVNVDISQYTSQTQGMDEVTRDKHFRQAAVAWIAENPGSAAVLYVRKALNYFNFRNELHVASEQSRLKDVVLFISYYSLLLMVALRILALRRIPFSPAEYMLYVLYFGNAFVSAIFFTRIRFRVPFDILLIAMVAIFIGHLLSKIGPKSKESHSDRENPGTVA
jgi:hypothetical protein